MFRFVANYTYDWESWHDPSGRPTWINDVERMTGYSVAECLLMKNYPVPIVMEKDQAKISQMLKSAIAGESHNNLEFEIIDAHGDQRWMAISWQPIFDDEQHHLEFRTSVRYITDRQGLKEQLHLYTEHLEQLVQEHTAEIAHSITEASTANGKACCLG